MDLLNRIREEQIENTLDASVQPSDSVFEDAADDVPDGMVFETSGSSGSPKRIPYGDIERVVGPIAECLGLAGFEDEVILNLGAPRPHPTGWGLREAAPRLDSRATNGHFKDYRTVIENGSAENVTAVFGVPSVTEAIGAEIAATDGPLSDVFPNVELIGTAGDLLTANRRETLTEMWGADTVREMYGASEFMGIAAAVDDTRKLVPLLNRFVLEMIPDDDPDSILDIRDVVGERRGSVLITDPSRETVDLTRYRIGDKVAVYEGEDLPRITVLGREDDSINLAGALLYPSQIHEAIRATFGAGTDWVAKVTDREHPKVDFYVIDEEEDTEAFIQDVLERNGPVREAYRDVGVIKRIDVHYPDSREAVPGLDGTEGIKTQHVVFGDSYTGRQNC
ncbi:MAG: GH3 auxin-responsive promoter family protein [Halobacteriales archaeon]